MRGILSYGTYVPYHRLELAKIAEVAGGAAGRGSRAVASYDEDTTTMGVAAARAALAPVAVVPDTLWFATAQPAYAAKTNANAIHAALQLPVASGAYDIAGAARSSVGALRAAASSYGVSVAVAADMRTGLPGGPDEREGGDSASAIVFGDDTDGPVIVEMLGGSSATDEFLDRWRNPGEARTKQWEERFGETQYLPLADDALSRALSDANLQPSDLDRVILTGLHSRAVRAAGKKLGLADKLVADLGPKIGNSGGAHAMVMLASVLDQAEPGQTIAVISLADGVDVWLLRTTDAIASYESARSVAQQIEAGSHSLPYGKFLSWRGMLTFEPPRRPEPNRASASAAARRTDWKYGFVASQDKSSGAIHMPPARISFEGGAVDDMQPIAMADKLATVVTFTVDKLAYSPSPPTVFAVLDFDGGGRLPCELTDVDADEVEMGDRVEMTFRKLNEADGIKNYFWKARPVPAATNETSN